MGTWLRVTSAAVVVVALGDAEVPSATLWIRSEEMTIAILGRLACPWSTPICAFSSCVRGMKVFLQRPIATVTVWRWDNWFTDCSFSFLDNCK